MINNKYKLKTNNYIRVISEKKQIIFGNTYNYGMNHIIHSVNRNGGTYSKCPHFTILKDGSIYQHFETKFYSNFLDNEYSKDVISVALENIGQLNEENGVFFDIYNNKYEQEPFEKTWKNCTLWDKYADSQFEASIKLVEFLLKESGIQKNVVNSNVQKADISNFKGIGYKSNYDSKFYDLNPSWDFEKFKQKIEKNG
jgi:hypothetical protein